MYLAAAAAHQVPAGDANGMLGILALVGGLYLLLGRKMKKSGRNQGSGKFFYWK
jgi:flagellar biogenesis protein FliO